MDTRNDSKTSDKFGTHADDSNEKDENDMSLDRKARFAITKNKRHSEIVFGSLWTVDEHDNDCSSNNTGGIDGTLEVALKVPSARDSNNKYAIQRRHSL